MKNLLIDSFRKGDNNPPQDQIYFDSSCHTRFENGIQRGVRQTGCNRRFLIESNITHSIGYTITMFNLDGIHPIWNDNIQMSPKQMKIISVVDNNIEFRGFGYDSMGNNFSDYGIIVVLDGLKIDYLVLNMYDRNISIIYER